MKTLAAGQPRMKGTSGSRDLVRRVGNVENLDQKMRRNS